MKKTAVTLDELCKAANSRGEHRPKNITCKNVGKTIDGKAIWREVDDEAEYVFTDGYFLDIDTYADRKGYYTSDLVDFYTKD